MAQVFIALGSNMGDRQANLDHAQEAVSAFIAITARSTVHETDPAYVTEQPRFLNMVLAGETVLSAETLLVRLKEIERELGRRPTERFGPRVIDLDILYYAEDIIETPDLIVPHPRLAERRFVLEPLLEIAPDKRHPATARTTADMLERLVRA